MASEQFFFESATPETALAVGLIYVLLLITGTLVAVTLVVKAFRTTINWGASIDWLTSRPWSWREGLAMGAIIGILLAAGTGLVLLLRHPRETTLVILQSLLLDGLGIAAIAALLHRHGWNWKTAFGMTASPLPFLRPGLYFYLASLPFLFVSSLVYQGILSANGYPPSLQEIALLLSGNNPLWLRCYMAILAVVVAPFFEECLFRGLILPLLVRRLGLGAGIFLTSLAFASIHFHFPTLIPLLVIATAFSLAYLYTRSLWVPIVMHGLFNGVNLALLLAIRH